MSEFFKVVVFTPRKDLFAYLLQNMVFPDLELFYLRQLDEVESYVKRVRPRAVILYVDHNQKQLQETLTIIEKILVQKECWVLLLASKNLSSQKIQTTLPVNQVFLQKDSDDFQQVAHNLMFIRSLSMQQSQLHNQKSFADSTIEFFKIIYDEKKPGRILERMINLFPKKIEMDYWAIFTLEKFSRQVGHFSQFIPPTRRNKSQREPDPDTLAEILLTENRTRMYTAGEKPELFDMLKQSGWQVQRLYFVPMQYREQAMGGILLGHQTPKELNAEEMQFLNQVLEILSKRILELYTTPAEELDISNFADELLANHFDEEVIFEYTCRKLTEVTKASSAIYWQYNKGFGFMFPKHLFFTDRKQYAEGHDRDMVFFDKETFLTGLINRGKMRTLDSINAESRLDTATQTIFQKLQYRHLLMIPFKYNGEVVGAMILNNKRPNDKFDVWHIHQAEAIVQRTQQVLQDAQTVKEANRQVKLFSRIFDFGRDAKLDLTLTDLLARLNFNLRKSLGWNDIAILLIDETGKHLKIIHRIGFDQKVDFGFVISDKLALSEVEKKLKAAQKISNSYLVNSSQKTVETKVQRLLEWETQNLVIVPLETRQNVLGYLLVADPVDRLKPTEDKITPLEYYANLAAVSVENSILYDDLLNSQERYRSLSETMSLGLVTNSIEGKITYLNPAFEQLLGYKEKHLLNQKLIDFFSPTSRKALTGMINELLKTPDKAHVETMELEIISKSGETIPVNVFGFPFYERRKQTGFFLILNDLRMIKRMERMKADFNSMIVHDLRSPMNVIQGFVELIRNKVVGEVNPEQEELLDIVKENVKKVLALVDNFLVASKLEVGKFTIDLKQGEINSLIRQQIENHRILMKNKQIVVESNLDANLPIILFDPLRIEQVINNLLSNAIKFTPEKGKIVVTSCLHKKTVEGSEKLFAHISVKDTGVGIPQEKLPQVFEKYEQVEDNQSFNIRGTGLGLSICKEIIELHKGEIWVESSLDEGSTFHFTLPIDQMLFS